MDVRNPSVMNATNSRSRAWIAVSIAALAVLAWFVVRHYLIFPDAEWSIITPPECADAATKILELQKQDRYDQAIELALKSVNGQHADYMYQMVATTYFMRSIQDKDQSGKWARLAAEYSEKAYFANPNDVVNVFNVGVNYVVAGDDLSEGGCAYYRKAWSVFESLSPKLEGEQAEAQGRMIRLSPLRKENRERMNGLRYRLRRCQKSLGSE